MSIENGDNLVECKEGDLCFEMEGPMIFGRVRKFNPGTDISITSEMNEDTGDISKIKLIPAIRLAGYTFQPGRGRFESYTQSVLKEEGISPAQFNIKEMDELSVQGGFRQAVLYCQNFSFSDKLEVAFKLPKGSYATTLLRELVKPEDPIAVGF